MTLRDWTLADGWWIAPDGTRLRAMAGGGGSGGGKTIVTNQIPPKTPEEIELIGKQNQVLDIQIQELRRQNDALAAIFPEQKKLLAAQTAASISFAEFQKIQTEQFVELSKEQLPFLKEQIAFAREQIPVARRASQLNEKLLLSALSELEGTPEEREIRTLSNQRALAVLKGEAPPLLPGQKERIDKIFGTAREEATTELTRFGEDLAATRGMRVTDSPIGGELLRQKRTLEQNLAAGKAGAELNVGQTEQIFAEGVRQFQENLRQRAFENRLVLTGRAPTGGGLPLTIGAPGSGTAMNPIFAGSTTSGTFSNAQGLLANLSADRLGQRSSEQRAFPDTSFNYGRAAIGGAGGALAGAGTGAALGTAAGPYGTAIGAVAGGLLGFFGGGFYGSSATLKKDILPLDVDEYEKARRTVAALPVARWRYKDEPATRTPHIGVIAELSPDEIRDGPLRISAMDLAGLTLAAVKGVDRRLDRLEARLPVEGTRPRGARLPVAA